MIPADQIIAPYDVTLMGAGRKQRRIWDNKVLQQLVSCLETDSHIVLLAGRDYSEFVAGPLRRMGHVVDEPLAGLRQGEQLARFRLLSNESLDPASERTSRRGPRGPVIGNGTVADELLLIPRERPV